MENQGTVSNDIDGEGSRTPSRSGTSTPNRRTAPLLPQAGDVAVPSGTGTAQPHDTPSIRHDLNSAHRKKKGGRDGAEEEEEEEGDAVGRTSSPGMGTSNSAPADGPPDWMNQTDIIDNASHGALPAGSKTSHADVEQLRRAQHPDTSGGSSGSTETGEGSDTMSGPTGLSVGDRGNVDREVRQSGAKHDAQQRDLLAGKPSRDGEGSAGLPFDAGN